MQRFKEVWKYNPTKCPHAQSISKSSSFLGISCEHRGPHPKPSPLVDGAPQSPTRIVARCGRLSPTALAKQKPCHSQDPAPRHPVVQTQKFRKPSPTPSFCHFSQGHSWISSRSLASATTSTNWTLRTAAAALLQSVEPIR